MTKEKTNGVTPSQAQGQTRKVRLPGFVRDEDIGLGDAIKSVTSALGIRPCGG